MPTYTIKAKNVDTQEEVEIPVHVLDKNSTDANTGINKGFVSDLQEAVVTTETVGGINSGTTLATGTKFTDFVKQLLVKYQAPVVRVTSSNQTKHVGETVASFVMTATVTKRTENITKIEFYNGSTLVETITEGVGPGGTFSHTFSNVSADATFTIKAYTTTSSAGVSGTNTIRFYNYVFYGSVDNAPTESTGLSHTLITTKVSNQTYTHTNKKACYAYPASYGNLSHIYDSNGFDYINGFTKTTAELETGVSYNIYTQNNSNTVTNFVYKFS